MTKKGILEKKLEYYYEDIDPINYRYIFTRAVSAYRGEKFSKILDIGAGIGLFLDSIKSFGFDLSAIECSNYGIKRCKEKGLNVINFMLEKDHPLPFKDNSFSLVLLNQVIEHLPKDTGKYYIKEIIRILEPGGVGIIQSPSVYAKIFSTDPRHIYCWKPNELLKEIQQYQQFLDKIELERIPLEPWMVLYNYDEKK